MAVDTLFLCFLEDMERNDGTPEKPYFMSRGLQKIVGKMQKFNVEKEEHRLEQVRRMEHQKKYGTTWNRIETICNDNYNLYRKIYILNSIIKQINFNGSYFINK